MLRLITRSSPALVGFGEQHDVQWNGRKLGDVDVLLAGAQLRFTLYGHRYYNATLSFSPKTFGLRAKGLQLPTPVATLAGGPLGPDYVCETAYGKLVVKARYLLIAWSRVFSEGRRIGRVTERFGGYTIELPQEFDLVTHVFIWWLTKVWPGVGPNDASW